MKNYKKTKLACYLGFITQAVAANFAPLLFLKFHTDYDISLGNIALISTFFFFTQLLVDLFCAKYVDKIGYRVCIVASEVCSAAGLAGLALLPEIMPSPFAGIIISVILYAIGSGLIEVLGSPIVEACPFENKEATMSLLHSFYCWGAVGTILVSTVFLMIFGIDSWKWLAVSFAIIPAINIYNFATCPIELLVEEGQGMGIRKLFSNPMFLIAIVMMVCSGASELAMAQWASAYAESALGFSKAIGDIAGPCMFAVTMGISRVLFGKASDKMNLNRFMIGSGILCFVCYLLASFSDNPIIGLAGCIVCGFSVGIMWPGTISISSKAFPTGGTAMFALLAMAGDLGGSIGPAIVGRVADMFGGSINVGMRIGLLFPSTLCFVLCLLNILNHAVNKQK
ncbi:MFS transporter [Eshraghiella crossota]|uniref:MFS transporter n=1 Tax=Eshraghiella crossota TaxID=45851 RepID=UPI003FD8A1EA